MRICGIFRLSAPIANSVVLGPMLIDGVEPKFFIEALRKGIECQQLQAPDGLELWRLSFFAGSRFACQYIVAQRMLREHEDIKRGSSLLFDDLTSYYKLDRKSEHFIDSGRLCFQVAEFNDASVVQASLFVRGSKALLSKDFSDRRSRQLAIDARGLAMITTNELITPVFQRYCVLFSLLRAYQYAIDQAVVTLADLAASAESVHANTALSSLRRDTLVFAARFLFLRPVRLDTVDLRFVWEDLAAANHLSDSHAELTEQLNEVHALMQFDHDQQVEARERKVQFWLACIGILLAAIALLEVTPTKLKSFIEAWMQ